MSNTSINLVNKLSPLLGLNAANIIKKVIECKDVKLDHILTQALNAYFITPTPVPTPVPISVPTPVPISVPTPVPISVPRIHDVPIKITSFICDSKIRINALIPGVKRENVNIVVKANKMTINCIRKSRGPEVSMNKQINEIYIGSFSRTITLPWSTTCPENIQTTLFDGILSIYISKINISSNFIIKL